MSNLIPEACRLGPAPQAPPPGALVIEWLGTAGFRIVHGESVLLIDPYFTRPGLFRVAFLKLYSNARQCAAMAPRADHIIVSHSHCDHLLDVPDIARHTGAVVHGSASTAAVCRGAGVETGKIREEKHWEPFDCGPFRVTFVPSIHGKALFNRVPYPGQITEEKAPPQKTSYYKHGDVFGILIEVGAFRFFHIGSAAFIEEELAKAGPVDALFVGMAGRKGTPDFMKNICELLSPSVIVGHHFDNFFLPFRRGLRLNQGVNINGFVDEARAAAPQAEILLPDFFEKIIFDPNTRQRIRG